jgi:hypothetical protein
MTAAADRLTDALARDIAERVEAAGFDCSPDNVWEVARWGQVNEGVVSPIYDDAVTERIQEHLDDLMEKEETP